MLSTFLTHLGSGRYWSVVKLLPLNQQGLLNLMISLEAMCHQIFADLRPESLDEPLCLPLRHIIVLRNVLHQPFKLVPVVHN